MFNAIKRLFGFGNGKAWLHSQRENLRRYLTAELGSADGLQETPLWTFDPYVAIWAIPQGWAITDPLVALHVVGRNNILRTPRDAARYFGRHFRETAVSARRDDKADIANALSGRADALLRSVDLDTGWPNQPRSDAVSAEPQALQALQDCLKEGANAAIRVIHIETAAPGGPFHAVYCFLELRPGRQLAAVFDALGRLMLALEAKFAPLVAWRVQYALVVLGINFGEPTREIEAERQADQMRRRHRELSDALDRYSSTGKYPLAMHLVDDQDVPFTANPVSARSPAHEYKPEAKFFDVRTHPFHQSLEKSEAVGMRLIAGSIAPEVIQQARRAFAKEL
jgi:hypothetical protein